LKTYSKKRYKDSMLKWFGNTDKKNSPQAKFYNALWRTTFLKYNLNVFIKKYF